MLDTNAFLARNISLIAPIVPCSVMWTIQLASIDDNDDNGCENLSKLNYKKKKRKKENKDAVTLTSQK